MRRLLVTFIFLAISAAGAYGQSRPAREAHDFDDDGGRVFLLRRDAGQVENYRFHGGAIIASPHQVNIFLGSAWGKEKRRAREADFADLLAGAPMLSKFDVAPGAASISREELIEFPKGGGISDLGVQAKLVEMFEHDPAAGPDASAVYVVLLAPNLGSTVGESIGRKHYLAYHNFFHVDGVEVHYTVVPYEADPELARTIAFRTLLDTIINPTGAGWY